MTGHIKNYTQSKIQLDSCTLCNRHLMHTSSSRCTGSLFRRSKTWRFCNGEESTSTALCNTTLWLPLPDSSPHFGLDVAKARKAEPKVGHNFPCATAWQRLLDSTQDSMVRTSAPRRLPWRAELMTSRLFQWTGLGSAGDVITFFFFLLFSVDAARRIAAFHWSLI